MVSKGPSKTLFVGNLHASLEESDLLEIFKPFGRIVECCKRWCHYGFIQFAIEDEAQLAYNSLNGSKIRGRPMRIEFQRKKLRNFQALFEAEVESKINILNRQDETNPMQTGFEPMFTGFSTDTDKDSIHDSCSIKSSTEENNNLENMAKVFDDLLSEPSLQQPLGNIDTNRNLPMHNEIMKEKKRSETIKKYSQLIKANSTQTKNTSYLNNTSEFLKSLIHDSLSSNLAQKLENSVSVCSSPKSAKNGISPKKAFNRAIKQYSNLSSVKLFRSINNSHTICVEPTDVLEPLNEGDFAEYKLFPTGQGPKKRDMPNNLPIDIEIDYGFPDYGSQSHSLSLTCSNLSSVSSSMTNSPISSFPMFGRL